MHNLGHQGTPSGIVEEVVVDPELQRSGIGKAYDKLCYANDVKTINAINYHYLLTLKEKNAHSFYESLGFKKHGFSYIDY